MARVPNQSKWLLYYQGCLAVGVTLFFFTFLDTYVVTQQIASSPVGWILPYWVLTIPLFIQRKVKFPPPLILFWCLGYLLIGVISYFVFSPSESSYRALIDSSFSSIFLLITTSLLMDQRVQHWARVSLAIAVLIGVLNNCYQIFRPDAFAGLVEGRTAGLYMDPNDCAYALVVGMILTVSLFPQKLRIPWILIIGVGVALTFSRGGALSWILVVMMMGVTRIITYKQAGFWILVIGVLLLGTVFVGSSNDLSGGFTDANLMERVDGILHRETLNDPSVIERKGIMGKAWEMFLEHPVFGQGIGSTFDFSVTGFTVSTHNMYLLHAAEYGLFGLPIVPLALLAFAGWAFGETKRVANVFIFFILFASLFSHTVLDQRSYLVAFAFMGAMSVTSELKRRLWQEMQGVSLTSKDTDANLPYDRIYNL